MEPKEREALKTIIYKLARDVEFTQEEGKIIDKIIDDIDYSS